MATWKHTMLFNYFSNASGGSQGQRSAGWSESWYRDGAQPEFAAFRALCRLRSALLSPGSAIVGQRFQDVTSTGGTTSRAEVFPGNPNKPTGDVPSMSLLCNAFTGGANVRRFTMRGLADARVVEGEYVPSQDFTAAMEEFFAGLVGWQMQAVDLAASKQTIVKITDAGVITLEAAITLGANSLAKVLRTTDDRGDRHGGLFRVTLSGGGTTATIINPLWAGGETKGGKLRAHSVIYPAITRAEHVRVITRKVGRVFFSYRGRAQRRR